MSAPLVLGRAPTGLTVHLARAGFTATLRSQGAGGQPVDWPAGAALRLVLQPPNGPATSWPATIVGPLATITIPAAAVLALPAGPMHAQLWLDYGDGEFLWCSGAVLRSA